MHDSIPPTLRAALAARGYETLTPVQEDVLAAPPDGDLLVSAQTGSGKTVAYGLALAATLLGDAERLPQAAAPLALVVAPTRELAMQVHGELAWLYAAAGGRVVSCIGGMDPKREAAALFAGAHIVGGTPGRLCDHLARGRLNLATLSAAVLDEADEMLDLGFRDELETLLDATPATRRTLLFSATLPKGIVDLARRYQRDAHRIETGTRGVPHADIDHRAMRVARGDEEHAVVNLLRYVEAPVAMVFCGTRDAVRHLHGRLQERGFSSVALSGELSQSERSRAVHALRTGRARVCVATDVAARGLDLPNLDLVIHADLPQNPEVMLHRSGRTGRAGRKGMSVLVVPYNRARRATQLLQAARLTAHWTTPPDTDQVRAADEARLAEAPFFQPDPTDEERTAAAGLLERVGAERVAVALRRLHQSALPEPEDLAPAEAAPPPRIGQGPASVTRPRNEHADDNTAGVWFSVAVGRRDKADPKWLIPLICRAGPVRKVDIGAIRIVENETLFEIRPTKAASFAEAIASREHDEVRFSAAASPSATISTAPRAHRPSAARSASSRRRHA